MLAQTTLKIHWVPHSHDDVGWLSTTLSLQRQNVSNIINGVIDQLSNENDPDGIRRFSWEEIAWLRFWWASASPEQRSAMQAAQASGRLGFYDSGITQHDNACPDIDSMLANWEAGWRLLNFTVGPGALPSTAASLDPFGLSASNGALLRKVGMQDWVFWRMPRQDRDRLGNMSALDFRWKPSSSVPSIGSVLVHETYISYCIPHDFEFGQDGVPIPKTQSDFEALAKELVTMIQQRRSSYPTNNLMFLAGCDYHYQHAEVNYASAEQVLRIINGTQVDLPDGSQATLLSRFSTTEEYFAAVREDEQGASHGSADTGTEGTELYVKQDGGDFFTYSYAYGEAWWAGYFVSRPLLKQMERETTSLIRAAGIARATIGLARGVDPEPEEWEDAQAAAAIITHHDAITGTSCVASEGCTGKQEDSGAHDVVDDYMRILGLAKATASSQLAAAFGTGPTVRESLEAVGKAAMAGDAASATKAAQALTQARAASSYWSQDADTGGYEPASSTDLRTLAAPLEAGMPAYITVFNPSAHARTDALYLPLPVCDADVEIVGGSDFDSDSDEGTAPVEFEIRAQTWINDLSPYAYVMNMHTDQVPPLGSAIYKVTPHVERCTQAQARAPGNTIGPVSREVEASGSIATPRPPPVPIRAIERLENTWIAVDVDTWSGPVSWLDKSSGINTTFSHSLVCREAMGDAYALNRSTGATVPCDSNTAGTAPYKVSVYRGPITEEIRISYGQSYGVFYRVHKGSLANATASLGAMLHVEARLGTLPMQTDVSSLFDVGIDNNLPPSAGGYQASSGVARPHRGRTDHDDSSSGRAGLRGGPDHTAREQDILSPWFYGAQNAYEVVPRRWNGSLPLAMDGNMFPVQADAFIRGTWRNKGNYPEPELADGPAAQAQAQAPFPVPWLDGSSAQLTIVVDRSHAGGPTDTLGRLELLHHRRTASKVINPAIVLDDTTRVMTRMMVALGPAQAANRQRHALWERTRDPLAAVFSREQPALGNRKPISAMESLPLQLRLQAMHLMSDGRRWQSTDTAAPVKVGAGFGEQVFGQQASAPLDGQRVLLRLQHRYAALEDEDLSKAVNVDVAEFVRGATGGAVGASSVTCEQTTATGHKAADSSPLTPGNGTGPTASGCNVTVGPMDIATVLVQL